MGHNLGFQERWEFRKKEISEHSSSDDDSKSNSEQALKNQRWIVEDDYHSDNPTQIEPEVRDPETKGKSKCKKPRKKQQTKVTKRNKMVNEKIEHVISKKARRKKCKGFAYDPSLMEDFKRFSESLLEDMKVTGETLLVKMKEEVYELISNGPPYPKDNSRSNKVGCALEQNLGNSRYDQMPLGQDNCQIQGQWELNKIKCTMNDVNQQPAREDANVACDFSQVQHPNDLVICRGLPNTSLNRPFVMLGGSERTQAIQRQQNSESDVYRSEKNVNLASSGKFDKNGQNIVHQHSLSNFDLGMLHRNEERGQLCTWRTNSYGLEITEVERMNKFKADVSFMKDDMRQPQTILDGRVAFHGHFSGPIILRESEHDQRGRFLSEPKFTSNFSSQVASPMYFAFPEGAPNNSYIKSQSIRPSTNFSQHMTSGNQTVMNVGFTRMKAEASIGSGYLGIEQNRIRSIPRVDNSDCDQISAPNYCISNCWSSDRMFQVGAENSLVLPSPCPMPNRRVSSYMPQGMVMPPHSTHLRNGPHFGN